MVTRNKLPAASVLLGSLLWTASAGAYEIQTNTAKMQAMDKITGRVSVIEVPVNGEVKFGSFSIVVRACKKTPPEETPENYAFVDVADTGKDGKPYNIFKGWMMSSSPALNAVEHPIYDVWLLQCIDKTTDKKSLLSDEALAERDGLPRQEDLDKAEKMSKEALIAAEAEAEEKQAAAEETPEEENKAEENTAEPDALQTKEEELPVVPAALQESMTQDGDEKTEDNAPVSLLPAGNKEVSPADDAQAADTGAPQPLFSIPDEADKETQPTELLPEKPVSDEQTEQDKSPAMPAGKTIGELPANQPAAEDKHSSDDELPVVEALSEDEAVEDDQFIDADTAADLEAELKKLQNQ
ncbi:MAG: hypothetical protein DBX42_00565 [Azospirillum sp.]|nr:MAG: hypothetical protein DBX42_00565 [Azospirillum sp.]